MECMSIEPGVYFTSDFCVWYEVKKMIILADLHIGYDHSFIEEGMSLPIPQKKQIMDRLSRIFDRYDPEEVIVVGDFKHTFSGDDRREAWDIREMIDHLSARANLTLIRGNHDNYLRTVTERKGIPFHEDELRIDGLTLAHGHRELKYTGSLIMGHEHPAIRIRDEAGGVINLPCFLYHPIRKIVVLPAFNPLFEGRDMLSGGGFISRQLRAVPLEDFFVYPITENGLMDFRTIAQIRAAIPPLL